MKKYFKTNKLIKNDYNNEFLMKNKVLFFIALLSAIILFCYIGKFQDLDIYKSRSENTYNVVKNVDKIEVLDEDTPIGIKQEYKWKFNNIDKGENYIAFYMVHQYANVYFNGNLMYSLKSDDSNRIGKTPGSNWAFVPVYPEDNESEVCVEIIPAYNQVKDREVEFVIGSKFDIYLNQFKLDLPHIILGLMAVIIGTIFLWVTIIKKYKNEGNLQLMYFCMFLCSIGIWKLTDIRMASLICINNGQVLSYVSITMIYIAYGALLLSVMGDFSKKYYRFFKKIITLYCIGVLIMFFLQMINIADLRESLYVGHIMMSVFSLMIAGVFICERKNNKYSKKLKRLSICSVICACGFILDILVYYIRGNSVSIVHTIIAFIICIIILGYMHIIEMNERANLDIHTGLYNKSRCSEFLDENHKIENSLGIIMFDLNGLKHINDTLGHEQGDILISDFAKIIKKNVSNTDFAGRYGGDEFMIVVKNADNNTMRKIDSRIAQDVMQYNKKNSKLNLSYSIGYCLSIDHPELSLRELLEKADASMYHMKREYHNRNL